MDKEEYKKKLQKYIDEHTPKLSIEFIESHNERLKDKVGLSDYKEYLKKNKSIVDIFAHISKEWRNKVSIELIDKLLEIQPYFRTRDNNSDDIQKFHNEINKYDFPDNMIGNEWIVYMKNSYKGKYKPTYSKSEKESQIKKITVTKENEKELGEKSLQELFQIELQDIYYKHFEDTTSDSRANIGKYNIENKEAMNTKKFFEETIVPVSKALSMLYSLETVTRYNGRTFNSYLYDVPYFRDTHIAGLERDFVDAEVTHQNRNDIEEFRQVPHKNSFLDEFRNVLDIHSIVIQTKYDKDKKRYSAEKNNEFTNFIHQVKNKTPLQRKKLFIQNMKHLLEKTKCDKKVQDRFISYISQERTYKLN